VPQDEVTQKLNDLLKVRDTLISQRVGIENQLTESKAMYPERYKTFSACFKATLKTILAEIAKVEKQIDELTKKDPDVKREY
jgi:VIT1/CCC1 family predicted Fe2+/Mn2+ transporter